MTAVESVAFNVITSLEEKLLRIGRLLEQNGCDCECEHHRAEHSDDCIRCLACRISEVIS